jgi:glycosyltransferase involved in cell wall biosynthesis
MKPLVSILIPAFNSQEWIADTIRSALNQSWLNKEIIVVDDGSRDNTLPIARQFASKTVSVLSQANKGSCAARNKAFELCQGDYIQWLDADDLLSRDKISKQMKVAEECASNRALFSCAWGYFMYRPAKARFVPTPLWCDLSPAEWLYRKMSQNLHMQTATWLVSRELTEVAGPWNTELRVNNDGEYFCRVLLESDSIRFIRDARVFYRHSGFDRVSYIGQSEPKMESLFLALQLHIRYVRTLEDSDRVRAACVNLLQTWLFTFYPKRLDLVRRAEELAKSLGGRLEVPRLSWKYAWIQKSFGWPLAKRSQLVMRQAKWSALRSWDKALSRFDSRDISDCVELNNSSNAAGS